ncbi:hypothetical protein GCM10023196_083290 [Actinoallomurus vinaceus]|uniref:HNH endonuclease n=1 Tax=Actinoallomurus vinaceus TaxID=1080074 RepID=A0ABP8UQS5_9ACTN
MRVMLQPASLATPSVRQHYEDTIQSLVDLAAHAALLGDELGVLQALYPNGYAPMWGVTPGLNNANVSKYQKLSQGDYVFFYGGKRLYLGGLVTHTFHNPQLAEELWGRNKNDQTWEYMYALDDLRGCDIPIEEVRECLPNVKSPDYIVQNPYMAEGEGADNLIELAQIDIGDVPSVGSEPSPSDPEIVSDLVFDKDLERRASRAERREQPTLKKALLPGLAGECALCGRTLPRRFLWAAHIKKRSECSDEERRDLSNIAMLACILGCDALYEHGYITVASDGTLIVSKAAQQDSVVNEHIERYLKDRTVSWWSPEREKYFAWHREHTYRADLPS